MLNPQTSVGRWKKVNVPHDPGVVWVGVHVAVQGGANTDKKECTGKRGRIGHGPVYLKSDETK